MLLFFDYTSIISITLFFFYKNQLFWIEARVLIFVSGILASNVLILFLNLFEVLLEVTSISGQKENNIHRFGKKKFCFLHWESIKTGFLFLSLKIG